MKNKLYKTLKIPFSKRSNRLLFSLVLSICFFIFIGNRPWYEPCKVDLSEVTGPTTLTIERSDGSSFERSYNPGLDPQVMSLASLRLISLKTKSDQPSKIKIKYQSREDAISYEGFHKVTQKHPSARHNPEVTEAIQIVSVFFFLLLWLTLENTSTLKFKKNDLPFIIGTGIFLVLLLFLFFPGMLTYDIFDQYSNAANFRISIFCGDFFSSLVMVTYQVVPHLWLFTLLNLVFAFFVFVNLYMKFKTKNVLKYYYWGLAFYLLYPSNILTLLNPGRDFPAFCLFILCLLKLYEMYLDGKGADFLSMLNLFSMALFACLLREENIFVLLPSMCLLSYFFLRPLALKVVSFSAVILLISVSIKALNRLPEINYAHYKATLIINPLSSILKAHYNETLPPEVDKKLGPFFKNNYLLKFQSDFDIDPFHLGGLNIGATYEDFLQFRDASVEILWNDPILFLKNRLTVFSYILGFRERSQAISDEYFTKIDVTSKIFNQIKSELGLPPYERPQIIHDLVVTILRHNNPLLWSSYLLPLLVIVIYGISFHWTHFYSALCFALLLRSTLVFFTAPAGYFKYLYPIWIFAPFVLPFLIAEKRRNP